MVLKYTDYLLEDCDRVYYSSLGLNAPSEFGESKQFEFGFEFTYDEEELEKQSQVFLDEVKSRSNLARVVDLNLNGNQAAKDSMVKDTYKYSFIKTYCLCRDFKLSGKASIGSAPSNSLVFYGHKELFLLFVTFNVFYHRLNMKSNTTLNKSLSIDIDAFRYIQESEIYKSSVNSDFPGYINNPVYERLLDGFKWADSEIQIEYFDSGRLQIDPAFTPLGNMAFRQVEADANVNYFVDSVTVPDSHTDHVSKYWNIANFIKVTSTDEFFPGQVYPYISLPISSLTKSSLFAQVESITGIKCGSKFTNYGKGFPRLTGYNGPNGYGPSPNYSGGPGKSPSLYSKRNGNGSSSNGESPKSNSDKGKQHPKSKNKRHQKLSRREENTLLIQLSKAKDSGIGQDLVSLAKEFATIMFSKTIDHNFARRMQREIIESSGYTENSRELYTRFRMFGARTDHREVRPHITYKKDDDNADSFQ